MHPDRPPRANLGAIVFRASRDTPELCAQGMRVNPKRVHRASREEDRASARAAIRYDVSFRPRQSVSDDFREALGRLGKMAPMSRKGYCSDHAVSARVLATLKTEEATEPW